MLTECGEREGNGAESCCEYVPKSALYGSGPTMNHQYSSFLFARPSFFEGVGRVLDFGGTLTEFNRCPNGPTADAIALMSDWAAIGYDLAQVAHAAGSDEQEEQAVATAG